MAKHKYATGDRVSFTPSKLFSNVPAGVYTIVRPMPVTNAGCQYRVKNARDNHERVLDEAQLHGA